eukprot:jgi/Botrbrau1/22788/Bobra.0132s0114.1
MSGTREISDPGELCTCSAIHHPDTRNSSLKPHQPQACVLHRQMTEPGVPVPPAGSCQLPLNVPGAQEDALLSEERKTPCISLTFSDLGTPDTLSTPGTLGTQSTKLDLGPLRQLPHELLCHVFAGLPQATLTGLSTCGSICRHAVQLAFRRKQDFMEESVAQGSRWLTPAQLRQLLMFLERFKEWRHITTDEPVGPKGFEYEAFTVDAGGQVRRGHTLFCWEGICVTLGVCPTHPRLHRFGFFGNQEIVLCGKMSFHLRDKWVLDFRQAEPAGGGPKLRVLSCDTAFCSSLERGQALLLYFRRAFGTQSTVLAGPMGGASRQCSTRARPQGPNLLPGGT